MPPENINAQFTTEDSRLKLNTMQLSIKEGIFTNIGVVAGDQYIIPYALALNATIAQIGMLNSIIGFFSPVSQILGAHLMERHSRKGILVASAAFQVLIWPALLLLGLLFAAGILESVIPISVLLFYLLYICIGGLLKPAWFTLMGDVVPDRRRGQFFAKRNMITTAIALGSTVGMSFLLDYYDTVNQELFGFAFIFLIALVARIISINYLRGLYYPPIQIQKDTHVGLWKFIKSLPKHNFGHFTIFVSLLNFSQMIAGPFFSVYMLVDLQFNYTTFVLVNISTSFVALFVFPILGKLCDKKGSIHVLRLGSIMIPVIPLLWMFMSDPIGLILGPQLFSGIGWTAFNLAASNFIYDSIPREQRGYYVSYFNFFIGLGILTGGLAGSALIYILPMTFINQFFMIFLISSIARGVIVLIFLPKIREIKSACSRQSPSNKHVFHFRHFNVHKWIYFHVGYEEPKITETQIQEHPRLKDKE